jgi:hypothetical protein
MLLAALVALAQLFTQRYVGAAQFPSEPARGRPLVILKTDSAHRALEESLAAALRAGGIATLDMDATASMSRAEIDNASLGAKLFACTIGSAHFRWPASRPPSAEILILAREIPGRPKRPRLIVTVGRRLGNQRESNDTWLTLPGDLTPESEGSISKAAVLWILARSGS